MRRQVTSFSLILCGLCFMFGGIASLVNAPIASAKPILAPSPRPPVDRPSDGPRQSEDSGNDHPSGHHAVATGRLTGTIIDATTGAPMPGVTVRVGEMTVTSDANGNYDHWLPVGNYTVGLMLTSQQGVDLQGPQAVTVRAGDTTVQHLYFRSQAAPTATNVPFPEPTSVPPALPINNLPDTGVAEPAQPAQPAMRPTHLPRTAVPEDWSWAWLSLGLTLVVVGTLVGWSGRRVSRRTATRSEQLDDTLLQTLLAAHSRRARLSNEELLQKLLDE